MSTLSSSPQEDDTLETYFQDFLEEGGVLRSSIEKAQF